MYSTILHPTDGSAGARRAADHAIVLGARGESEVPGLGRTARRVVSEANCPVFTV